MASAAPVVHTKDGQVRGSVENGAVVFRGIPFAKPPVGALRFQAPAPPEPWEGVRDATAFGPQAPQAPFPGMPRESGAPDTGEWLTVNVWTPDVTARTLPVLVWIHGGAYLFGSAADDGYDGGRVARGGAGFLFFHSRRGVEGFAQTPGAPPNRGLLDA